MRYLYTFILSVLVLAVAAQEQVKKGTLSGVVTAADTGESLQTAALQLLALPDTIYKSGVATDVHGGFSLVAPVGSYILRATYVGYLTADKKVTIAEGKNTNIGKLILSPDVVLLKGAEVTAEVPPITVSEDTTVYNTAAFRVPAGSMLEELIKKYPGVEISDDGTIKINGKTVSRILMKGKDFFGTDKDMALKNIPVDVVDKVKFYDKKSDFARITGIDDGEEETVLDLQMRRDVEEGIFANADLGYGTKERYSAKGMANYFTDTQRYTLILSANNTNDRGMSGGGRGGGLNNAKTGGFNFVTGNDTVEFGGNVRFNHNNSDSRSYTSSERFMVGDAKNQFSNSNSTRFGHTLGLNANFRLEWKPDTMTRLIFQPAISYSKNENYSRSLSAMFDENPFDYGTYPKAEFGEVLPEFEEIAINRNSSESLGLSDSRSVNASLMLNRRLEKPGRNVTFRGNVSYSQSESDSYSMNDVNYYRSTDAGRATDRKRYSTTPNKNWSYSLRGSYTEPLLKNLFLQLNYSFNYSYQNSDRSTYVFDNLDSYEMYMNHHYGKPILPEDYEQYFDKDQSRYSVYRNMSHDAQIMLRYITSKANLSAGVSWQPVQTEMEYKYLGLDTKVKRTVHNVSPNINFRYRWSKTTSLRVRYRGSMSQPSMTDMLDITDDSNPLNITKGNPGLKPSFNNNMNADFITNNPDKQRTISANMRFGYTLNSIERKMTYDEATGVTTSQPDNINGNWNISGGFNFNSALPQNKKYTYSTSTTLGYKHNVGYISTTASKNSVRNIAETVDVGESLNATYRSDYFDLSLDGRFLYSHSTYSMRPENNMDTWNFSYGPSTTVRLPWQNLQFSTNLSMSSRRGYSDPQFNTNELLWNAQVSMSFLEKNALTLSFRMYDILQEQSNVSRAISATSRSDSENNSIYSYCMFHLVYKFNQMGHDGGDRERGRGAREYNGGGRPYGPPGGYGGGFGGGRF